MKPSRVTSGVTAAFLMLGSWTFAACGSESPPATEDGGTSTANVPAAPRLVSATSVTANKIWIKRGPVADATACFVMRLGDGGDFQTPVLTNAPRTNALVDYIDTGLAPKSTYCYGALCVNHAGQSPMSNLACATTLPSESLPASGADPCAARVDCGACMHDEACGWCGTVGKTGNVIGLCMSGWASGPNGSFGACPETWICGGIQSCPMPSQI